MRGYRIWSEEKNSYLNKKLYAIDCDGNVVSKRSLARTDFIAEQYTCLKDKNGVEIYEGDIVTVVKDEIYSPIPKDFKGVVMYSEAAFWIDNGNDCAIPVFQEIAELEVIGNIHQHKHLLK